MSFPDNDLTADMQEGFRLTGCLQDTRTRPGKVIVHALTGEDVWSGRKSNNDRMWATCRPSGDPQLIQDLWQQTLRECKAGWATLHVGLTKPPGNAVLSRRFGVQRHEKTRPIDDISISQINSTLGSVEKVVVIPSSSIVSLAEGPHCTVRIWCRFQCTRRISGLRRPLCDPTSQRPAVLSLKALPFGATGCRCSLALWAVVLCYILVPSTVFFDDYTAVISALDSSSAEAAFILPMKILGWKIASDKGKPFSCLFHSWGVSFLLPRSPTDPVQITNTHDRKRNKQEHALGSSEKAKSVRVIVQFLQGGSGGWRARPLDAWVENSSGQSSRLSQTQGNPSPAAGF